MLSRSRSSTHGSLVWQLATVCNSSFRGSGALFWRLQVPGTHVVYNAHRINSRGANWKVYKHEVLEHFHLKWWLRSGKGRNERASHSKDINPSSCFIQFANKLGKKHSATMSCPHPTWVWACNREQSSKPRGPLSVHGMGLLHFRAESNLRTTKTIWDLPEQPSFVKLEKKHLVLFS